jgi:alpha-1,6-mannosyltransferase
VDSLAGAIQAMYERDLAEVGAQARRKAEDHHDWNQIFPQLLQRYGGLLAGGERAALLGAEPICVPE